jgi:hypothetical protein
MFLDSKYGIISTDHLSSALRGLFVAPVLDSVSSPITKRVHNLGLNGFIAWYGQEPQPGFTKAIASAWRVGLEARSLGSVSINVRITTVGCSARKDSRKSPAWCSRCGARSASNRTPPKLCT